MKTEPITQKLIDNWQLAANESSSMEGEITNRIDYIIRTIFDTFNKKLDTWYFDGAGEGDVGDLLRHYDENEINIITELSRNKEGVYDSIEMVIIDKEGSEWGFDSSIPTRWLFEDFEQELIDGKKLFEEQKAERKKNKKELSAKKKLEDQALATAAKAKLSKKELAALRRSL
jgi:hypothetical protein